MKNPFRNYSSDPENPQETKNETEKTSFFGSVSGMFGGKEEPEVKSGLRNWLASWISVEKSWTNFSIVFLVGIGLLAFSLMLLPMVVYSPAKFTSLFSLGSFLVLLSFLFMYGTEGFLDVVFDKKRIWFSLLYIVSIVLSLWFSMVSASYFLSLLFVGLQAVGLAVFVLSFIPGGSTGISFLFSMILAPFKAIVSRFMPSQ